MEESEYCFIEKITSELDHGDAFVMYHYYKRQLLCPGESACVCSYPESEEMTRHANLCAAGDVAYLFVYQRCYPKGTDTEMFRDAKETGPDDWSEETLKAIFHEAKDRDCVRSLR